MKTSLLLLALLAAGSPVGALADSAPTDGPTAFLEAHDAEVRAIVMRAPEDSLTAAQRDSVRQLINDAFDFRELCRLSLGETWEDLTPAQRDEFVDINRGIIELRNLDLFVRYHRQGGINYTGQSIDEAGRAEVRAEVQIKGETKEIAYALHRPEAGGSWQIYDLVVDGAGTVAGNNRTWNRYIARHSYERLVEALRKQLTSLRSTG